MNNDPVIGLLQAFTSLLLVTPVVVLAFIIQGLPLSRKIIFSVLGLASFFILARLILSLPPLLFFKKTLWQGMFFQWIFSFGVLIMFLTPRSAALQCAISASSWLHVLWVGCLMLAVVWVRGWFLGSINYSGADKTFESGEYFFYILTMPGIAEEFVYRGVIQGVLNEVFGRPWKLFSAPLGWGWVISSVLFWAIHAVRVSDQLLLSLYWPTLTLQLGVGFILGWMRERSNSLMPAIFFHNAVNIVRVMA